jgi:hypothetical protein
MLSGLIGLLILINAFVWPQWSGVDGWIAFFGLLLVISSIFKAFMPGCGCHHFAMPETASKEVPIKENPLKEVKKKK